MDASKQRDEFNLPFPVPSNRFDQKNEVFKRGAWDGNNPAYSQCFFR